jgi:hypothetical protein
LDWVIAQQFLNRFDIQPIVFSFGFMPRAAALIVFGVDRNGRQLSLPLDC